MAKPGLPCPSSGPPSLPLILVILVLLALSALAPNALAQQPVITSFAADPPNIKPGQSSSLAWSVAGATSLTLDQGVGVVSGTSTIVSPVSTTTYTLTAANAQGSTQAATTVTVSPLNYLIAYDSGLQGTWRRETWESVPLFTDFSASAPGRTGRAIEVRFGSGNAFNAFGIGDVEEFLNEFRTFEFDIYFEPDSTGEEDLTFILGDAGLSDQPRIVDLIPEWSTLPPDQRVGRWLHATVDLPGIHPLMVSVSRFLWFNNGSELPHFRLADVKLGWANDTTPPAVTQVTPSLDATTDQLSLAFATDEPTIYRVEYGVSNYVHATQGDYHDWRTNHTAVLAELTAGMVNQYRIVVLDHHNDPNADANIGTYNGSYLVPPSTNAPRTSIADSAPDHYLSVYDSALADGWTKQNWETSPLYTDFSAPAPGRAGNAIELRFGTNNSWNAFGLGAGEEFFNEFRTIEFDVYFEPDSSGNEDLSLVVADTGLTDSPRLVDLIPGWFTLPHAQRSAHWFHVVVDLAELHPRVPSFGRFLFFNGGADLPHFRLADIKLGWSEDTTAPVVTLISATLSPKYDQLTLVFTTDETTLYRVEFGTSDFNQIVQGDSSAWATTHSPVLTGLSPGTTVQYRIVALDHRADPAAVPNEGTYLGTYAIPSAPVTPPVISGLEVRDVLGTRATLVWKNDRPCTAQLAYHKSGGTDLTRSFSDLVSEHMAVMDLLEPLTSYQASVTVTDAFNLSSTQSITFTTGASSAPTVTITVNPSETRPISPYVYGINFYEQIPDAPRNLTLNRAGGNRWTAYNWENNASNAGSDWYYSSDDLLGGGDTPGEAVRSLIAGDRARGNASLITVQLQGFVAADEAGSVDIHDPNRLATRFKQVIDQKGSAFTLTPDPTDGFVYMDEFVWALGQHFATDIFADPTTPTFVSLDNEPELWPYTHAEIQTGAPKVEEYLQNTIKLTTALKNVAPSVQLFGPVHYGFEGMLNWQGAPGFDNNYWFTEKYLADMKAASAAAGHRLLDVYDFHWYPEAKGDGTRIGSLTSSNLNSAQIQGIVQSPRSLWDPTYREDSWVADALGGAIYILGRIQAKIDAVWPGTKVAISEYGNGGDNHIAGAIAQADNLGVFGSRGVFAASFWPTSGSYPFILAGFKMYRDYDGNLGSFGDISLPATSSDTSLVSAYVSQDSHRTNRYVLVAINRSESAQDLGFTGLGISGSARVYRLEGTRTSPVFVGEVPANLNSWVVTLPALSVSTIEIIGKQTTDTYAAWMAANFSLPDQGNAAVSGLTADPDSVGIPNLMRYAFNLPARGPVSTPGGPRMVSTGGQDHFAVEFSRRAAAQDLSYLVQASSDLVHWTPLATIPPGEPSTITTLDTEPVTAGTYRFLRVQVQYTP